MRRKRWRRPDAARDGLPGSGVARTSSRGTYAGQADAFGRWVALYNSDIDGRSGGPRKTRMQHAGSSGVHVLSSSRADAAARLAAFAHFPLHAHASAPHIERGKAAEAAWRPGRGAQMGKGDRLLRGGRAGARRAVLRSRARRQAQRRAQGRQLAGGARLALCGERTIQASRSHKFLKSTPIARVIGVVPFSHGE